MAEAIMNQVELGPKRPGGLALDELVEGADILAKAARVGVYTEGYPARVREALLEAYPAVHHVVGEECFTDLVFRYLQALPEDNYNLNEAGRNLPAFLRTDPLAESLPFLPDLAGLEWHMAEAFHAPLLRPFEMTVCAGYELADWQNSVVGFQPSLRVIASKWPILEIHKARSTPVEEIDIELEGRPEQLIVYRCRFDVMVERIGKLESKAVERLAAGQRLGEVLEELSLEGLSTTSVMNWFSRWTNLGLITDIRLKPSA